ncbi:MAG: nucleoside hydrolase [Ferruginibacter sp.]
MLIKSFLFSCVLLFSFSMQAQKISNKTVPVIFDSDMGPDYDDVGAITMLHAYADSGQAKILATIASTKYQGVAGVFNVFNTYFSRPNIPIAVPRGKALELRDTQHWTDSLLANYPHKIKSNDDVPDAVDLYRKILAGQPDRSVTVITVGFLTNLANLYQSKPDRYSALDGKALIKKKVKLLVCMAGKFPEGHEFNVREDAAASKIVYDNWETPVILSGFEIGKKIKAGLPLINNGAIKNSPVKDAFRISIPLAAEDSAGRSSWDETAVLIAIKGYERWYSLKEGKIEVAEDGRNTWNDQGKGQFYIIEKQPYQIVQSIINEGIMHQPGPSRPPRRGGGKGKSKLI